MDGGTAGEALKSFAVSTAMGLALGAGLNLATKGISKVASKIKLSKAIKEGDQLFDTILGGKQRVLDGDELVTNVTKYNAGKSIKEVVDADAIATQLKKLPSQVADSADDVVKSFNKYSDFTKAFGKAKDYVTDGQWHHIVEQQTVKKGINSAEQIYNTKNTVAISKKLHQKISGYYSSRYGTFPSFRQYINTLPYEQQYVEGMEVLKMFAEKLGEVIVWL